MALTTYKWSVAEWHKLVNSGVLADKKVELLEGEIVQMSPEGIPHRNTNHKVVKYLRKVLDGLAEVYESHPITLDNSEPEPDIAIVRLPESIYDNHHPYPQDIYWLIEISNQTLTKDLEQKRCDPADVSSAHEAELRQSFYDDLSLWLCERAPRRTTTYARNSIAEYWVIDLKNNKLIVHTQPQNNSYDRVVEYKSGVVSPLAFPNIVISLDKILLY